MSVTPLTPLALVAPSREWLREFELALAAGWSPNTEHDISAEQLRELRRDREAYLEGLLRGRTIRLSDGSVVPRLPFWEFWIVDGSFCGRIGLRFRRGTEALPPYALGHIGYAIVPWKRRLGYATEALRQILPYARAEGLSRVQITCDDDNEASQRVILANRGVAAGKILHPTRPGHFKLSYWVPTGEGEPADAVNPLGRRASGASPTASQEST
jgi:predicted acetyltransferase